LNRRGFRMEQGWGGRGPRISQLGSGKGESLGGFEGKRDTAVKIKGMGFQYKYWQGHKAC